MLGRLWRMTGYISLDCCIFTEILKWTWSKQWRCSYLLRHEGQIFDNFKKFLSIRVIKIVLDSMLYETLKWSQIAPFCISSKTKFQTPLSMLMACTLLSLSYASDNSNFSVNGEVIEQLFFNNTKLSRERGILLLAGNLRRALFPELGLRQ